MIRRNRHKATQRDTTAPVSDQELTDGSTVDWRFVTVTLPKHQIPDVLPARVVREGDV